MQDDRLNRLFEDIGHIKATQTAMMQGQQRIERSLGQYGTRLRKVEGQAGRLLTLAGVAAAACSAVFGAVVRWFEP